MEANSSDVRPLNWADAFPWLPGALGSAETDAREWWLDAIDDTNWATRQVRLGTISELAMARLARWTIGEIFPGLSAAADLSRLELPARAINALERFCFGTADKLVEITLAEMLDWRNIGVGTVDAILRALADLSTSASIPEVAATSDPDFDAAATSFLADSLSEWTTSFIEDLKLIAVWYGTVGLRYQPILGESVTPATPQDVIEALRRLSALTPSDVLSETELDDDIAKLFDDALARLDQRAIEVLQRRLFADEPETLDELGRTFGVTRERIRQIEAKARGTMSSVITDAGPLERVAESARLLIGTVRPLEDLLSLMPALGRDVWRAAQPAWRVLDRLDDAYEIEDGWCVVPTMTAARALTQAQLQERADQYGVVRLDEVELVQSSRTEHLPELSAAWLSHCGYILHNGYALTRTSRVGDYAAAILAIQGSPLSAQEIVDRFSHERSTGSTRNAMGIDDRFERVDRDQWALKEWGMEAYGGIRSIIRELVARGDGRADLAYVVEYITARYSVTASSVAAYAAAPPFVTREGAVQVDIAGRSSRKVPQNTRRLFRRSDGWAYRITVTTEHLRGSGSVAPIAVASVLGLQPGQSVQLASPLGPQALTWNSIQPTFGTIRRFLMDGDVPAGTEAFLLLLDNGTFAFERARELVGSAVEDALALVAAPPLSQFGLAREALARAIKLHENSPIASIIGGYSARGDDDVAALLLAARAYLEASLTATPLRPDADVDEIMDLL